MAQALDARFGATDPALTAAVPSGVAVAPPGVAVVSGRNGVSWAAIIAGAVASVGATIILLVLGSGLGFAAASALPGRGASATALTIAGVIWLLVTQWLSAALGGYLAGRLRSRWLGTHEHEVFFRDTAHGLITWAVTTVLMTWLLTSSATAALGGGLHVAETAVEATSAQGDLGYGVDKLLRAGPAVSSGAGGNGAGSNPLSAEAARIAANAVVTGKVPEEDRAYLTDMVVSRSGLPRSEAQARVDDFFAQASQAAATARAKAEAARKAAAEASIYIALSLLVGAFISSVAAALGGRLREGHV